MLPFVLQAKSLSITPQTQLYFDDRNIVAKTAAQELSHYLEPLIHGNIILSAKKPPSDTKSKIILARKDSAILENQKLSFTLHRLKEDGFVIYISADTLYIVSQNDRGLLYGVYYFLEKYVGYRFLAPDFTYTPPPHKVSLQPVLDIQEPAFTYREIFITESDDWKYATQNRLNGRLGHRTLHEYQDPHFGKGINIFNTFTPFALVPDEKYHCNGQLIYSSKKVQKIATAKVGEKLTEIAPSKEDYLYIQHEDRNSFCTQDGATAREATAAFLHYGTYIATHATAIPDNRFLLEAYQWTRTPPDNLRPLPRNISIMFSTIEANFAKPLTDTENRAIFNDLKKWGKYTEGVIVWHYTTNFSGYFQPHPNLYALAEDIKKFSTLPHVKGVFLQGCYETPKSEFAALRTWVFARLLWDPNLDTQKLIREFCTYYYGPAAHEVLAYIQRLHRFAAKSDQKIMVKTPPNAAYLQENNLDILEAILQTGMRKVENDPPFKAHLEEVFANLDYVRLLNSTDTKKADRSAKRFLAFLKRHPQIQSYAEGAQIDSLKQIMLMRREKPLPPNEAKGLEAGSQWLDFQEYTLRLCCTKLIQDPDASDNIAAIMSGKQPDWGFQLDINNNLPKGEWDIYARIKITLRSDISLLDKSRIALFFGIYPTSIKGAHLIAQFTPGKYKTIRLTTLDTRKEQADYLWISPPQNDVVKTLFVDRIFAIRRN